LGGVDSGLPADVGAADGRARKLNVRTAFRFERKARFGSEPSQGRSDHFSGTATFQDCLFLRPLSAG
jgi:hypothetical protein